MKSGAVISICGLAAFLALSAYVRANVPEASSDPYRGIVDRNVFGLKPPPAPPDPKDLKPPAPDLNLTGITTILGNKRALLKAPAKPPLRPKDEFYILTEGQSESDIEVLAIDEVAGTVKVRNHGTEQELSFANNSVKGAAGSPGGAPPPLMGMNTMPGQGGMKQIPPRPLRSIFQPSAEATPTPTAPSQNSVASSAAPGQMSAGFMLGQPQSMPQNDMGLSFSQNKPGFTTTPDYGLTRDEQDVLIEANRAKLIEEGRQDEADMLPPTEVGPVQ